MIYDTFLFSNELELLKVRLHEIGSLVDKFVLVESRQSQRGTQKPLCYSENQDQFAEWNHKIDVIVVDNSSVTGDNVQANSIREKRSREAFDQYRFKDNSTIIYGDADEIVRASVIRDNCPAKEIRWCDMQFYHFFFNCIETPTPRGARPVIAPSAEFKAQGFEALRWTHGFPGVTNKPMIPDGGWHFSFLGGPAALREKISWAVEGQCSDWVHKETDETLLDRMVNGKQYDGNPNQQFIFTPKEGLPSYVQEHWDEYKTRGLVR